MHAPVFILPQFPPHRFFWLDPKLLLQSWQHGGKVSVLHPLEAGKRLIMSDIYYLWKIMTFDNFILWNLLSSSLWNVKISYIDNADDAIEEHVNFLTCKYLHEVWPGNKDLWKNQVKQYRCIVKQTFGLSKKIAANKDKFWNRLLVCP